MYNNYDMWISRMNVFIRVGSRHSLRKETSPTLNRDGGRGRELSKIYDSPLETPKSRSSSRTAPTASSRNGSVSRNSATIR